MTKRLYYWGSFVLPIFFAGRLNSAPATADNSRAFAIYNGRCELNSEGAGTLTLCLKGHGEAAYVSSSSKEGADKFRSYGGSVYAGLHLTSLLSAHFRGRAKALTDESEKPNKEIHRGTDLALLQIGNPSSAPVWLSGGLGEVPFGFHARPMMSAVEDALAVDLYRENSRIAALGIDNRRNRRLEIAAVSPRREGTRESDIKERDPERDAFSIRFSQDIPELHATRVTGSFYGSRRGERVAGVGILNRSPKGEVTTVEYMRERRDLNFIEDSDRIELRITYQGEWVSDSRVVIMIDDQSLVHRSGFVGGDWRWFETALTRLTVGYIKSESDTVRTRWLFMTGLEADL